MKQEINYENYNNAVRHLAFAQTSIMRKSDWEKLTEGIEPRKYEKGQLILKKNKKSRKLLYIKSGAVKLNLEVKDNSNVMIRTAGNVIGETEYLLYKRGNTQPTQADIVAVEDCTIVPISFSDLTTRLLVNKHPETTLRFYYFICTLSGSVSLQLLNNYFYTKGITQEQSSLPLCNRFEIPLPLFPLVKFS